MANVKVFQKLIKEYHQGHVIKNFGIIERVLLQGIQTPNLEYYRAFAKWQSPNNYVSEP